MNKNKVRINEEVQELQMRMEASTPDPPLVNTVIEDKYISFLIKKNIRIALDSQEIDELNYFSNADYLEQYGVLEPEHMHILKERKDFDEYIKRKKSKKGRKNPKGVLKTACAACLSNHHEQYNPLSCCPECHLRFHKHCY